MNIENIPILRSFRFAFSGLAYMITKERNFRIETMLGATMIIIGLILGLNLVEWLIVLIFIAMVLAAELVNTVVEDVCNILVKELQLGYQQTKAVRDIAAGSVLVTSVCAFIAGILIIGNHL
jgi:undecaprenol kinase/diacylglycerol kinase (ATP)